MRRCLKIIITVAVVPLVAAALVAGCALREFGQVPQDTSVYEGLPYFAEGTFHNRNMEELPHYPDRVRGGDSGKWRFILPNANAPDECLPMQQLGKDSFASTPEDLAVYWLGHSSLLIELDGKRLLVDPVFDNAAPVPFIVRRYGPAPLTREDLPLPDYILLTHDHYDHLEYATMRYFRDKETVFIVPLGVGAHLLKWGVPAEKIHELGWGDEFSPAAQNGLTGQSNQGEQTKQHGIRIVAEPAHHFSGRTYSTRDSSLWASYVLYGKQKRIFLAGDTGYSDHFKAIGEKHGPFDLAFFEIDGWNPGWPKTHLFPEEVIKAQRDVKAKALVPIHWAVFDLALHPWDESIRMVAALADEDGGVTLLTPLMGQKLVPGSTPVTRWWEDLEKSQE